MNAGRGRGGGARAVTQCVNQEIVDMLQEAYLNSKDLGTNIHFTYLKARKAVERYPVRINSGKEALQLKGIGDTIARMIDKRLHEINGGGAPARARDNKRPLSPMADPVQQPMRPPPAKPDAPAIRPPAAQPDYLREFVLNSEEEEELVASTAKRRGGRGRGGTRGGVRGGRGAGRGARPKPASPVHGAGQVVGEVHDDEPATPRHRPVPHRGANKRTYVPVYRSGAYAILVALRTATRGVGHVGFLRKQELMDAAQEHSDTSFVATDGFYSAWSSMSTLSDKGFVIRAGSPARYSLTPAGIELADKLLSTTNEFGGQSQTFHDDYDGLDGNADMSDVPPWPVEDPYAAPRRQSLGARSDNGFVGGDGSLAGMRGGFEPPRAQSNAVDHTPPKEFEFTYVNDRGCSVATRAEAGTSQSELGTMYRVRYRAGAPLGDRHVVADGEAGDGYVFGLLPEWEREGENVYRAAQALLPPNIRRTSLECRPAVTAEGSSFHTDYCSQASVASAEANLRATAGVPAHLIRGISITSVTSVADVRMAPALNRSHSSASAVSSAHLLSHAGPVGRTAPTINATRPILASQQSAVSDAASQVTEQETDYGPPFALRRGEFEVVLLVDLREVLGNRKDKNTIMDSLRSSGGIKMETRPLPVSDFLWIARETNPRAGAHPREVVLGFAIERKRMDDLASSIKDRRFQEQKFRLFYSGLTNVTLLVEEYGDMENAGLDADSLRQAMTNTQAQHGFHVKETQSLKDTASYLHLMSRRIAERFSHTTLNCDPNVKLDPSHGVRSGDESLGGCGKFQTYNAFAAQAEKSKPLALADMFARQLMQIHGVTPEKAKAITEAYPTPRILMDAYSELATDEERANMLSDIRYGKLVRNKTVGPTYSARIFHFYCDRVLPSEPFA